MVVALPRLGNALMVGIVGNSGKQGTTCSTCHSGGSKPVVRFEVPTTVPADSLTLVEFAVTSQSNEQQGAGFNVATDGGLIGVIEDQPERVEAGELTHLYPAFSEEGINAWSFYWRAPLTTGTYTLYGAGLSTNSNGNRNGDAATSTKTRVEVTSGERVGDVNCDGRLTIADTLVALTSGGSEQCPYADANCDGSLTPSDADAAIAALFDRPVSDACVPQPVGAHQSGG